MQDEDNDDNDQHVLNMYYIITLCNIDKRRCRNDYVIMADVNLNMHACYLVNRIE